MTIVASQTGDFSRDLGRQVMETLLQAHPDVNIVYAHNDEMAIGAIQALELAGRKPGDDVLVVSIDGTLEGTTGSSPANDRKKGFDDVMAMHDNMTIVASQTGDFSRDLGRQVMETLLQAHPDVNIVYAHNDEMAIGAIQALELAGRKPGDDVLVVSIDGTRDALQAIIDGKMGVTVESSPFFGPLACETMNRYANGETIEPWVKVEDRIFTKANAAMHIDSAY